MSRNSMIFPPEKLTVTHLGRRSIPTEEFFGESKVNLIPIGGGGGAYAQKFACAMPGKWPTPLLTGAWKLRSPKIQNAEDSDDEAEIGPSIRRWFRLLNKSRSSSLTPSPRIATVAQNHPTGRLWVAVGLELSSVSKPVMWRISGKFCQ